MVINILVFGKAYFSSWGQFILATPITMVACYIDFILCGGVAVILKRRFPSDAEVRKRLSLMIGVFVIISGLFLYFLFSFYELIGFYGYVFNRSGFFLAYACMGILNIFLTFLHEGVSRFERWKENLIETEELKKTVKQSQLLGLKSQVNPHFLFNCFNTLSSLISEDKAQADAFLNELSKVYRYLLRSNEDGLSMLQDELNFIKSYYKLLKTRHGDAILLQIEVDKKYYKYLLPSLSLQLLVENAVKHNIVSKSHPLLIDIFSTEGNRLAVNNNLQPKKIKMPSNKIGLANIRSKYELLKMNGYEVLQDSRNFTVVLPLIWNNNNDIQFAFVQKNNPAYNITSK